MLPRATALALLVALSAGSGRGHLSGAPVSPGVLDVLSNEPGTKVVVDGERRGAVPVTLLLAPGPHVLAFEHGRQRRVAQINVTAGTRMTESVQWPPRKPSGALRVTSSPAGALVTIDGRRRGKTPLSVEELPPGRHKLLLQSAAGSVRTTVDIVDNETAEIDVPIFAGWIAVFAPVELQIHENGRLLGTTETSQIMVPPGRHVLELSNEERGYRATRVLDVRPGEVAAVSIVDVP